MVTRLLRLAGAALMFALIAIAGGGLVVALDHPATDSARPELTARGDAAFRRAATPLRASLDELAMLTDGLARAGREASFALRDLDHATVRARLADGEAGLASAILAAERVRSMNDQLVAEVAGARLSARSSAALIAVADVTNAVVALADYQALVASAAGSAADVLGDLQAHDELVFEATEAARDERYGAAAGSLDEAGDLLAPILAERDTAEVRPSPTLDDWLLRATDYDAALQRLYQLLDASGGMPTSGSGAAAADVELAQAALPADGSALVVIASELAEPDLTEGLVGIEGIRGSIAEAVLALD